MAIKFEKKFKIEDVFNINTDYHLWMLSVGAARQDLYFVNEKLIDIIYGDKKERYFYYAKMSIAHVNEAVALLKVMQILSMILDDFLINKVDRNVGFQIKYRR